MEWKSSFHGDSTKGLNGYSDVWTPSQNSSRPEQKQKVSIIPFPKYKNQEFKVSKRSARWYLSYHHTQEIRDEWMKRSGQSEVLELSERQAAAELIQRIGNILEV